MVREIDDPTQSRGIEKSADNSFSVNPEANPILREISDVLGTVLKVLARDSNKPPTKPDTQRKAS
jgi:hypothetical protein